MIARPHVLAGIMENAKCFNRPWAPRHMPDVCAALRKLQVGTKEPRMTGALDSAMLEGGQRWRYLIWLRQPSPEEGIAVKVYNHPELLGLPISNGACYSIFMSI